MQYMDVRVTLKLYKPLLITVLSVDLEDNSLSRQHSNVNLFKNRSGASVSDSVTTTLPQSCSYL